MSDLKDENQNSKTSLVSSHIESISQALFPLDKESISTSQRVQDLQVNVENLKADVQNLTGRIEQNVELFRTMLSDKLKLIRNMLSDKQLNIDMTLEECYKVISGLVESFLNIGYESENEITNLSLKVDSLDYEIRKMIGIAPFVKADRNYNKPYWFIDCEDRLVIRENESMGSILPKFKNGDFFERKQFLNSMTQIFQHYKVPENAWVKLTTHQLIESAFNWWFQYENKHLVNWSKFMELFMDTNFENNEVHSKFDDCDNCDMDDVSRSQETATEPTKNVSNSNIQIENITENERDIVQCFNEFSRFIDDIASGYRDKDLVE